VFWWSIWFLITLWKFCHCSLLSLLLCTEVILVSFRAVRRDAKRGYWLCQVCLSVGIEQLGSNWTDIYEIWYLSIFLNMCSQNSSFIKIWKEKRVLYMRTCEHFLFACLCSGPLPVFHCSITAQKNCLLPQPYSGNRFRSVKLVCALKHCAEQWAFWMLLWFVSFAVFP